MEEFIASFVNMISEVSPYDIFWILGIRAYMFVRDALTGRNARL